MTPANRKRILTAAYLLGDPIGRERADQLMVIIDEIIATAVREAVEGVDKRLMGKQSVMSSGKQSITLSERWR